MSEERYRPPAAVVADVPVPGRGESPGTLKIAVLLLSISLAFGATRVPQQWEMVQRGSISGLLFLGLLAELAVVAFFIVQLARGRNWARILLALYLGISLASFVSTLVTIQRTWGGAAVLMRQPVALAAVVVPHIFNVVAMLLVFWPARAWFRPRAA